jgi:hypothetical protein
MQLGMGLGVSERGGGVPVTPDKPPRIFRLSSTPSVPYIPSSHPASPALYLPLPPSLLAPSPISPIPPPCRNNAIGREGAKALSEGLVGCKALQIVYLGYLF